MVYMRAVPQSRAQRKREQIERGLRRWELAEKRDGRQIGALERIEYLLALYEMERGVTWN